jgi:hypothetical protein
LAGQEIKMCGSKSGLISIIFAAHALRSREHFAAAARATKIGKRSGSTAHTNANYSTPLMIFALLTGLFLLTARKKKAGRWRYIQLLLLNG